MNFLISDTLMHTVEVTAYAMLLLALAISFFTGAYTNSVYGFISLQLLLAVVAELTGFCFRWASKNNIVVYNAYILFEFVFFLVAADAWYFRKFSKVSSVLWGTYLLAWSINVGICGIDAFANWAFISGGIMISVFFLVILVKLLQHERSLAHQHSGKFLCMGLIAYYLGSVPYFTVLPYLNEENKRLSLELYMLNDVLNVVEYVLFCACFITYSREVKQLKSTLA